MNKETRQKEKQERLAQALRDNLKRRKQQKPPTKDKANKGKSPDL